MLHRLTNYILLHNIMMYFLPKRPTISSFDVVQSSALARYSLYICILDTMVANTNKLFRTLRLDAVVEPTRLFT